MPTGAGKTVTLVHIVRDYVKLGYKVMIQVHRAELIYQISAALAEEQVFHTFISNDVDKRHCGNLHIMEHGRSYVDDMAKVLVASVPTINSWNKNKPTQLSFTLAGVGLCVPDEAHHTLKNNTFGTAYDLTPNARWMGVTATPCRTDGQGLGSMAANGIFETMVFGPTMRTLIEMGNLCDYDIYEPPIEEVDMSDVNVTAGGDYNAKQQAAKMMKPTIVGDIVKHYRELQYGKRMVTFCCDITHAQTVNDEYNSHGIPAAVLHGGNDFKTRQDTLTKFRAGQILVLNTVDLVSEGFDLPAIEGAQMLRRTMSKQWYMQAFGRILRPLEGKGKAFLLDHVGNWRQHGLPDKVHHWTLLDTKKGSTDDDEYKNDIPLTTCRAKVTRTAFGMAVEVACGKVYQITKPCCPQCGQKQPVSDGRGKPLFKEGKLQMVSAEELAALRGNVEDVDDQHILYKQEAAEDLQKLLIMPEQYASMSSVYAQGKANVAASHRLWQTAQNNILRPAMYEWLSLHEHMPKHAAQEIFRRRFGVDVYNAQTLKPKEAHELSVQITEHVKTLK